MPPAVRVAMPRVSAVEASPAPGVPTLPPPHVPTSARPTLPAAAKNVQNCAILDNLRHPPPISRKPPAPPGFRPVPDEYLSHPPPGTFPVRGSRCSLRAL
jgi:hypothetical protein